MKIDNEEGENQVAQEMQDLEQGIRDLQVAPTQPYEKSEKEAPNPKGDSHKRTDSISSTMTMTQVISILGHHHCPDVTSRIILDQCSEHAVDGGGWGDIYRGELKDGGPVAIKCARIFVKGTGQKALKNAAKELYAWSKCNHDHVIILYGVADFRGQLAMVSPWMKHGTIMQYINSHPRANRFNLCAQIASGLAYLHSSNITHGDVKGGNVLVSDEGVAKLTDFGSSVIKSMSVRISSMSGQNMISISWAAPETINYPPENPSAHTDVYSLGMTILEVITRQAPFAGYTQECIITRVLVLGHKPPRPECCIPLEDTHANRLWETLTECWERIPSSRPKASDVHSVLKSIKEELALCSCVPGNDQ